MCHYGGDFCNITNNLFVAERLRCCLVIDAMKTQRSVIAPETDAKKFNNAMELYSLYLCTGQLVYSTATKTINCSVSLSKTQFKEIV